MGLPCCCSNHSKCVFVCACLWLHAYVSSPVCIFSTLFSCLISLLSIGLGRIGFGVGKRLLPFGPKKILYHDVVQVSFAKDIEAQYCNTLEEMLEQVDFLCVCCNLTPQTRHKINSKTMSR